MKTNRIAHVVGLVATGLAAAAVQFSASPGAPPWAIKAAAWTGLVAALVTNLRTAVMPQAREVEPVGAVPETARQESPTDPNG